MKPISALEKTCFQTTEIGETSTQHTPAISTQNTRPKLSQILHALKQLKTLETEVEERIKHIRQQTNTIKSQLGRIDENKTELQTQLDNKQNQINKLLFLEDGSLASKFSSNINKVHKKIFAAQSSINALRTKIILSNKQITDIELEAKKQQEEIKNKKYTLDQIKNKIKNKKEKITDKQKEKYYLLELQKIQGIFSSEVTKMLSNTEKAVQCIKNNKEEIQMLNNFVTRTKKEIAKAFVKKIQSNREYDISKHLTKMITEDYKLLIDNLDKGTRGFLGYPRLLTNLYAISNVASVVMFLSVMTASIQLILSEHQRYSEMNISPKLLATILSSTFITLGGLLSSQVHQQRNKNLFAISLKERSSQEISEMLDAISKKTETITKNKQRKTEIKKYEELIINNTDEKDLINFSNKINKEIEEKITKKEESVSSLDQKIIDLEHAIEKKSAKNKHITQLIDSTRIKIRDTTSNIKDLMDQINKDETMLNRLREKEKAHASDKSKTIENLWSESKKTKNALDELEMNQETLTATLRSLELNLQEFQNQLNQQQNIVLKQMNDLDAHSLAKELLMPNMTEPAFHRLVERHMNIELNQLQQRVTNGHFKNSEGMTIASSAKNASTYFSFYHLLYSTMDAIDFMAEHPNLSPNVNYTIPHRIEVGTTLAGETGTTHPKQHSMVSYTPKVDRATGQRRMMIDHMF